MRALLLLCKPHLHDVVMVPTSEVPSRSASPFTPARRDRWHSLLELLVEALAPGPRTVLVLPGLLADRLRAALDAAGHPTVVLVAAPPADTVVRLRIRRPDPPAPAASPAKAEQSAVPASPDPADPARPPGAVDRSANIVVDLTDPGWPVLRHVDEALMPRGRWHREETRAFFAVRAATWDTRFGDDMPAYARAVAELRLPPGSSTVDVGCGTGRALPALRQAVGPQGTVIGIDLTGEMLTTARDLGRAEHAALVLGDARQLPLADRSMQGVFAAGLVGHIPNVEPVLAELARICVPGGDLVLFHPSGRVALAARHGHTVRPDEPLSEDPLRAFLAAAGWTLVTYDDAPDRFFARAVRVSAGRAPVPAPPPPPR